MTQGILVTASLRMYAFLAALYPAAHREQYAGEMRILFASQLREAHARSGAGGVAALWLRTIADFLPSVLAEHGRAADLRAELFHPDPSRRLPWKALAVVLAPGLVVCAGQLLSLAGDDWFFQMRRSLGFFLLLPALLAWVSARKFPLWGLLPLGMSLQHLTSYNWYGKFLELLPKSLRWDVVAFVKNVQLLQNDALFVSDRSVDAYGQTMSLLTYLARFGEIALLSGAAILLLRRADVAAAASRAGRWLWIAAGSVAFLLAAAGVGLAVHALGSREGACYPSPLCAWNLYLSGITDYLAEPARMLFLVGLSAAFAKRYGAWSSLLLLGYLVPAVIVGFAPEWLWDPALTAAILGWRFGIALVVPLVALRALSARSRTAAILAPLAVLLAARLAVYSANWYALGDPWTNFHFFLQVLSWGVLPLLAAALVLHIAASGQPLSEHRAAAPAG